MATVPLATKGHLIFASDSRCCVCQEPGDHVHHIDGNNKNHDRENLAFLCFNCHDRASVVGGLSSKLPMHAVREYRDHWHEVVRIRREAERRGPALVRSSDVDWGRLILDKLAVMEVRKIAQVPPEEWDSPDRRTARIRSLFHYTYGYGFDVRIEVVEAAHELAGPWSWRTPRELAEAMAEVIHDAVPIGNGANPPTTEAEQELLRRGSEVGLEIAYNAGRYMQDLRAVQVGCWVLEKVLRRAFLNGDHDAVESMKASFTNAMADSFPDGKTWMQFSISDATRPANTAPLKPPRDLLERLQECRDLPSPVATARQKKTDGK